MLLTLEFHFGINASRLKCRASKYEGRLSMTLTSGTSYPSDADSAVLENH